MSKKKYQAHQLLRKTTRISTTKGASSMNWVMKGRYAWLRQNKGGGGANSL